MRTFPPWLDRLWLGKASCFHATGNKKHPMSPESCCVKNSVILSYFQNHCQLYSGKVPFRPERVAVQSAEGTGIAEVSHLTTACVYVCAVRVSMSLEAGKAVPALGLPESRLHTDHTRFCASYWAQFLKTDKASFWFQPCPLTDDVWQLGCFEASVPPL